MGLHQKLLEMQKLVDGVIKDGKNLSDKYDFASDENVLNRFRPMMDDMGLLLIPKVTGTVLHEGVTKSGTTRYLTEMHFDMVWHDVESGEELTVPWYAQGTDLAGEKGPGKAATYAEKYFLLKFFHVPTRKDDPDGSGHTQNGELLQRGTAADREAVTYYRQAIPDMLGQLYAGDEAKIKDAYVFFTKSKSRGYEGVDNLDAIKDPALPIIYGKLKETYEKRMGHSYEAQDPA